MTSPLLEALTEHVAALRRATHLYVGFSGGTDSLCLLHALTTLAKRETLPGITAIHVNHGLHPDADSWEQHCCHVASELGVEIVVERVAVSSKASLEAQARNARYSAFEPYLSESALLLLAHHLDDQVETVLFRLVRGAGPIGLSGIPQSRSLGEGGLLRPLLNVSRSEIEDYASVLAMESINDPSNKDLSLDRNFLRHQVLPLIAERWPGYRSGIARTAAIMASIDNAIPDLWYECSMGALSVNIETLESDALHTVIRNKLKALDLRPPSHDALGEFCRQCFKARDDKVPTLTMGSCTLVCWRARIQLVSSSLAECELEEVTVGETIDRAWGRLSWVHSDSGLSAGSLVTLRRVTSGEKIKLPGRPSRALRHYMQEAGIAPYWRASLPMVCINGDLAVVPGLGCTDYGRHIFNGNSEGLVPVWIPPKIQIGN